MSLIIPANTLASGGFSVDNSLRFNDGSSDYLNRTLSATGNQKKWTWSAWVKISNTASGDRFLWSSNNGHSGGGNFSSIFFGNNTLRFYNYSGGIDNELKTNRLFRDVSAFYHLMVVYDSANGTADNRIKMYVNGVQETSFATRNNPALNYNSYVENNYRMYLGSQNGSESYFDGYLAEPVFVNNQALAPTDFGEFDDSGIWKPIDVSGLTFGTNGFYLETKQSGTSQNSSGLGADTSGNDNHFAVNNLTAIDQTTDTCTNNFCTMNPLDTYNSPTITDGNTVCNAGSSDKSMRSTIGISSGKWYWEVNTTANNSAYMGIVNGSYRLNTGYELSVASTNSVIWEGNGGILLKNGSTVTSSYSGGTSTYGFAFDLDNGTLKLSQNGTFYNSGNAVVTGITADTYLPVFAPNGGGSPTTLKANFGNPAYAISSGNQDGNGYGNFEYAVPSSYYALNTKNLAEYG